MAEVEVDIPAFLNGKAAASLTMAAGTNLFSGHPDDDDSAGITDNAVFCRVESGGLPPVPYFGGATAADYNSVTLSVYVRWEKGARAAGRAAAVAINKLLHKGVVAGYVQILAHQSSPVELMVDGAERHTWKMSYRVEWKAAL